MYCYQNLCYEWIVIPGFVTFHTVLEGIYSIEFLLYRWNKINIYYISKDFYIHDSTISVKVFFLLLTFHNLGIKQVVKHSMVMCLHDFFFTMALFLFSKWLYVWKKFTFQILCFTSLLRIYLLITYHRSLWCHHYVMY